MNGDNIMKFMKESLLHIANINRVLKNAKTEVLVNFIRSDQASIMVITNKVASSFNLVIIENYVKNINCIDVSGVEIPWFTSYREQLSSCILTVQILRELSAYQQFYSLWINLISIYIRKLQGNHNTLPSKVSTLDCK